MISHKLLYDIHCDCICGINNGKITYEIDNTEFVALWCQFYYSNFINYKVLKFLFDYKNLYRIDDNLSIDIVEISNDYKNKIKSLINANFI